MSQRYEVMERLRSAMQTRRQQGKLIRSAEIARDLLRQQPDCGMSEAELAEAVIAEAAAQGVAIEMETGRAAASPSENGN